MDLNGLHLLIGYLREDFKAFKANDFHKLEIKVEKISSKVAWIVGLISGIGIAVSILIRVL